MYQNKTGLKKYVFNTDSKGMKNIKYILVASLFLTSCNPFGSYSIINITPNHTILNTPTNFDLNSGGKTSSTIPASGQPGDVHHVTYKVGTQFTQVSKQTGDGHSVEIMLKTRSQ